MGATATLKVQHERLRITPGMSAWDIRSVAHRPLSHVASPTLLDRHLRQWDAKRALRSSCLAGLAPLGTNVYRSIPLHFTVVFNSGVEAGGQRDRDVRPPGLHHASRRKEIR